MDILLSLIPPFTVLVMAFKTKRPLESMIVGVLTGFIIHYRFNFMSEFASSLLKIMADPTVTWIVAVSCLVGGLINVLEKSGSSMSFANIAIKYANSGRKTLMFTWMLGFLTFIESYLNVLTRSTAMKKVADKHKIPREMFGFVINMSSASIPTLIPFSTWAIFFTAVISKESLVDGPGVEAYIKSIPFIFYSWISLIIAPLVFLGILPKIGAMKKAYKKYKQPQETSSDTITTNLSNFLIPVFVMIFVTVFTGLNLLMGVIAAILITIILYTMRKVMTIEQFLSIFWEGFLSLVLPMLVIVMVFTLKDILETMGFRNLVQLVQPFIIPQLLPAIAFLVLAAFGFVTGLFWGGVAIMLPIFIPMALVLGVNPFLVSGAVFSGAVFASNVCLYSDLVIITAYINDITQMQLSFSTLPYAIITATLTLITFIAAGFIMI